VTEVEWIEVLGIELQGHKMRALVEQNREAEGPRARSAAAQIGRMSERWRVYVQKVNTQPLDAVVPDLSA
jgi:hypothetical protein